MRVKARLRTLATRALGETMDVKTMVHLIRRLFGTYDLNERTGFPLSVPIPNRTAAQQIVDDVVTAGLFLDFVALLLDIERLGMSGRKYRFPRMTLLVNEILALGYRYDDGARIFVEDTSIRTTRNWGVLKEGESYVMAFLGVDVVGNTKLVKQHGNTAMGELYAAVRALIVECCEKRNGRLWGWEGDGGVVAFTFEEQNQRAALSGIELLNELLLYNLTECPLKQGLHLRLTLHNGACEYSESGSELKSDTIKRLWQIDDTFGRPDTMIITDSVYPSLERPIASHLRRLHVATDQEYYTYSLRFVD